MLSSYKLLSKIPCFIKPQVNGVANKVFTNFLDLQEISKIKRKVEELSSQEQASVKAVTEREF